MAIYCISKPVIFCILRFVFKKNGFIDVKTTIDDNKKWKKILEKRHKKYAEGEIWTPEARSASSFRGYRLPGLDYLGTGSDIFSHQLL